MPRFVVEREIPGAGKRTPELLHKASQRSVEVLKSPIGSGGRINRISEIHAVLDPTRADG